MNKHGKTTTIFLILGAIILLCLAGISFFFYYNESGLRKQAEDELVQTKDQEARLQADLKEAKKQTFLFEEKNKECDEKVNGLLDDLELEEGLREEIKRESQALKEEIGKEKSAREEMRRKLEDELAQAKGKITNLENELVSERAQRTELEQKLAETKKELLPETTSTPEASSPEGERTNVTAPPSAVTSEGDVLSIDTDSDFIIFSLGEKDGITPGLILSVYRKENYLGDVKVSRVHAAMSAADPLPPLSIRKIRKNDRVVIKQ
jgi:hypothetical protein